MNEFFRNQTVIFYIFLALSIIISRLPIVGKYFVGINTLIHETGHALVALFLSGKVHKIDLSSDASGSVLTSTDNKFKTFLVSIVGYPFSSFTAYIFFYLIHKQAYDYVLFIIISIAILNLILYVRNWYGIFWLLSFLIISGLIIYLKIQMLLFGFVLLCSFIILSDSILSAIILLIISVKTPKLAGDAKNLADLTHLPAVFWSLLFLATSLIIGYKAVISFFPQI
jgi:hypothetical protein